MSEIESLTWASHPAKIRKTATVVVLSFIVVVIIVIYLISKSALMVILAGLIFTGSLSTYFFPTRYEITKEKVKVKYLINKVEKDFKNFRSYYPDKRGVLLSPFPRPSRLENFRGIYIRYHQNKEEVDSFIRRIFEEKQVES